MFLKTGCQSVTTDHDQTLSLHLGMVKKLDMGLLVDQVSGSRSLRTTQILGRCKEVLEEFVASQTDIPQYGTYLHLFSLTLLPSIIYR